MAHPFKPATAEELAARGVGVPTPPPIVDPVPTAEPARKGKAKKQAPDKSEAP